MFLNVLTREVTGQLLETFHCNLINSVQPRTSHEVQGGGGDAPTQPPQSSSPTSRSDQILIAVKLYLSTFLQKLLLIQNLFWQHFYLITVEQHWRGRHQCKIIGIFWGFEESSCAEEKHRQETLDKEAGNFQQVKCFSYLILLLLLLLLSRLKIFTYLRAVLF